MFDSWQDRIDSVKLISDRTSIIKFDLGEKSKLTVINVYGPTVMVTREKSGKGRESSLLNYQITITRKS